MGTCAVFALVPILNSAFYALNSSYYARWYYMPVLVLAAMTVNALEDHNTDLDSPARGISWLMIATVAFAVVPVQDSDTGSWSFGVLKNPGQYCAVLGFGLLGLLLYRYLCQKWRGDSRFAQRMTAAVLAFAFLFSVVHIGIGKFGQWYTDSDLVKQDTSALLLKTTCPKAITAWIRTRSTTTSACGWIRAACSISAAPPPPASSASTRHWGSSGMCAVSRSFPIMHCGAF